MTIEKNPTPCANAGSRVNLNALTINSTRSAPNQQTAAMLAGDAGKPSGRHQLGNAIDGAEVNRLAQTSLPGLLKRLLPKGSRIGAELAAIIRKRADQRLASLEINRYNAKWRSNATGAMGDDVISLAAYLIGTDRDEAAGVIAQMLGLEARGLHDG